MSIRVRTRSTGQITVRHHPHPRPSPVVTTHYSRREAQRLVQLLTAALKAPA